MSSNNGGGGDGTNKATVLLIGIGITTLVVTIYHCIARIWFENNRARSGQRANSQQQLDRRDYQSSIANSTAQLIPAFKYQKGMGLMGDKEDTCAICLGEFEEEEELRTLPQCKHSYHLACIDKWLYSHSSCPVCRTNAASPHVPRPGEQVGSQESTAYQDLGMLQVVAIE